MTNCLQKNPLRSRRVLRAKRPRYQDRITIRLTGPLAKRLAKLSHTERRRFPIVVRDCFATALDQWEAHQEAVR